MKIVNHREPFDWQLRASSHFCKANKNDCIDRINRFLPDHSYLLVSNHKPTINERDYWNLQSKKKYYLVCHLPVLK